MANSLLKTVSFSHLHAMQSMGRVIAQCPIGFGVSSVELYEVRDPEYRLFGTPEVAWVVIRKIAGNNPQQAYAGLDVEEAVAKYAAAVEFARARQAQMWDL